MSQPIFNRVAAFVAGLVVFLVAIPGTIGLVLAAPIGVWVAHRFRRAHGQAVTAWTS